MLCLSGNIQKWNVIFILIFIIANKKKWKEATSIIEYCAVLWPPHEEIKSGNAIYWHLPN